MFRFSLQSPPITCTWVVVVSVWEEQASTGEEQMDRGKEQGAPGERSKAVGGEDDGGVAGSERGGSSVHSPALILSTDSGISLARIS